MTDAMPPSGSKRSKAVEPAEQDRPIIDKATEAMQAAEARLRATVRTIEDKAEELRRWGGKGAAQAQEQARELVEDRPLAVVGAALAIGIVIGMLASR